MKKLNNYLQSIKNLIEIDFPTVSGLSPYITKQSFTFLSITFHKGEFIISTKGKYLDFQEAILYSTELETASLVCKNLNELYIKP